MTRILTATEVKARLLALLDEVEAGEVIEITRHGLPIARLAPARGAHALKGRFADMARSTVDDEQLFTTGENWDLP
jgi:prevent-host-death family protein